MVPPHAFSFISEKGLPVCNSPELTSNHCKNPRCQSDSMRAHPTLMLCFDIPLQTCASKMHDPVRAVSGGRQVKEQGKRRQKDRKVEGEAEAELTSDLLCASWRVHLFFGATELAKKENLVRPHLTLPRWNNSRAVLKALLFCSSERSTLKGDIMRPLCTQHTPLCHHSFTKPALIIQNLQLTRSLQNWHRSFPPMNRVTSFQSFWKSTV